MTKSCPISNKLEKAKQEMEAFPYWYHRINLNNGLVTPGWAPINPELYGIPEDLTGKRVLDIGSWDGYWAFEALKRGAKEVVAIDDFSDFIGILEEKDRPKWQTFDWCREQLGWSSEVCQRREISVYNLSEQEFGRFDVVFMFGVLYHLRYPLLALDKISAICDGEIFIESAVLDDYSPYRGGLGHGYPDQMVMEFYPEKEYGDNMTNWWVPSIKCLAHMVRAAGFNQSIKGWKLADDPTHISYCRGFVTGAK
ncbi:MAG: glycosyltransferase [Chlamydiales bacterium]|jgi:tRNA (mo5U34)-methyltransferase|nr:glycosyltransferase [Chlamydiales bacterium]